MTTVLVTDASVVVDLLGRFEPEPIEALIFAPEARLTAPELLDVEVAQALRRLDRQRQIPSGRVESVLEDFFGLRITRYAHMPLMRDVWRLRHNLSAYDAAYVALAKLLDAALVTRDRRLAEAVGRDVHVEVP